jgi:hypothetical protein
MLFDRFVSSVITVMHCCGVITVMHCCGIITVMHCCVIIVMTSRTPDVTIIVLDRVRRFASPPLADSHLG